MLKTKKMLNILAVAFMAASFFVGVSACQPVAETIDSEKINASLKVGCQTHEQPFTYSICQLNTAAMQDTNNALQLFWQQPNGDKPLLTFEHLINSLPAKQTLTFAMNAGMYDAHYAPIGYTVIKGEQIRALNVNEGGGNFHLLPNGVLWWDTTNNVHITESQALQQQLDNGFAKPWFATQSGPMLVIDGKIHPKFNPKSTSLKFRNGAGVCTDGSIQFVNSNEPVTFYQFAALFKDHLKCPNALFLDGGIASALYAPSIRQHDKKEMGVMIGFTTTP